jgi:hypothetical protein
MNNFIIFVSSFFLIALPVYADNNKSETTAQEECLDSFRTYDMGNYTLTFPSFWEKCSEEVLKERYSKCKTNENVIAVWTIPLPQQYRDNKNNNFHALCMVKELPGKGEESVREAVEFFLHEYASIARERQVKYTILEQGTGKIGTKDAPYCLIALNNYNDKTRQLYRTMGTTEASYFLIYACSTGDNFYIFEFVSANDFFAELRPGFEEIIKSFKARSMT